MILPASLNVRSEIPLECIGLLLKFMECSSPRLRIPSDQPHTTTLLSASFFGRGFHGKSLIKLQEHPNDSEWAVSSICDLTIDSLIEDEYQCLFDEMVVVVFILSCFEKFIKGLRSNWYLCWQGSTWCLCSRRQGTQHSASSLRIIILKCFGHFIQRGSVARKYVSRRYLRINQLLTIHVPWNKWWFCCYQLSNVQEKTTPFEFFSVTWLQWCTHSLSTWCSVDGHQAMVLIDHFPPKCHIPKFS